MATATAAKRSKQKEPKPLADWEVPAEVTAAINMLGEYTILTPLRAAYTAHQRDMNEWQRTFCERAISDNHPLVGKEFVKAEQILEFFPDALGLPARTPIVDSVAEHNRRAAEEIRGELDLRDDEPATDGSRSFDVALSCLVRHPDNREPRAEEIAERAASLKEDGQLEPIVIRDVGGGKWQIISGETRYLGAKSLGWKTLKARAIACDDARALELLADFNAHRKDLNPIQRAKLIVRLCEPKDKGGSGLTQLAAAKKVGLESGAAASNLVRLLSLPDHWQHRVSAGELPESFARLLVPYAHAPLLMDAIEEDFQEAYNPKGTPWKRERWESRAKLEGHLDGLLADETRPVDGKRKHRYGYQEVGEFCDMPRLFELTDELREKLGVCEFAIDGKPVQLATNAKLFDKLNIPLVKAKLAKQKVAAAAKAGSDDESKSKREQTPAERKQREKEKAEQLANRIAAWRHEWLRHLLAALVESHVEIRERVLVWLATAPIGTHKFHPSNAICEQGGKRHGHYDCSATWNSLAGDLSSIEACGTAVVRALLLAPDRDPKIPVISHDKVDDMAATAGLDLDAEWKRLQSGNRDDGSHFAAFFALHQSAQLDELGEELGVYVGIAAGREAKLRLFSLNSRTLRLPKSIKPIAAAKPAKTAKRKGA